jgi:hypothetical protein
MFDQFATKIEDTSYALSKWWNGEYVTPVSRAEKPLPDDMYGSQQMQVGDRFRVIYKALDRRDKAIDKGVLDVLEEKIRNDEFLGANCRLLNLTYIAKEDRIHADFEVIKNPWPVLIVMGAIVAIGLTIGITFTPEKVIPLISEGFGTVKYVAIAAALFFVLQGIKAVKT